MASGNGHIENSTDSILCSSSKERNRCQFQDETETHRKIERNNLLNILKISIKTLIDSSLRRTRMLDETFVPLKQFFIVMEHIFNHGLKGKRSILGTKRDFLDLLESMGDRIFTMKEMLTSIHNVPTIKTHNGKIRAWLRMALMQKVLAQQLQAMIEDKELIEEWYEGYAVMLNEECIVISGLLVGLNVIDCNMDLKGENLDGSIGIVDMSLYLRDGNYLEKAANDQSYSVKPDQKLEMILDQKAYLEELNRGLTESSMNLQAKVSHLEEEKEAAKKELSSLSSKYWNLVEECNKLKQENLQLRNDLDRRLQIAADDINVERKTYHQSRVSLNEMYLQAKQQLEAEVEHCKEIQQDLQSQVSMNQEKEVAMRLLERDVHDKQDTLMLLRQQLEEVKKINTEFHIKQKNLIEEKQAQSEELKSVREEFKVLSKEQVKLEKELIDVDNKRAHAMETLAQMGFKVGDIESKRCLLEKNLKIEREWRCGVQKDLEEEKQKTKDLTQKISMLQFFKEENVKITMNAKKLEERCIEQEHTLIEMAEKLTRSQLHVDDMKEASAVLKEHVWKDNKTVVKCQQCEQVFSVAKRKHHCRSCGGIFCNSCSDNTMPLPSSAKPVRVCDCCHERLLARYKAT